MGKGQGKVAVEIPDYELVDVAQLDPLPDGQNINEMDDEEFSNLVESIKENGFIEPIQVVPMVDGRYRIVGGEHRWKAAQQLKMEKVPAAVLKGQRWTDNDLQTFMAARLNNVRGRLSMPKFAGLYRTLSQKYTDTVMKQLMGFKSDAWKSTLDAVKQNLKSIGAPQAVVDKFDKAKASLKSADQLSVFLSTLFSKHGSTLPFNFLAFSYGGKEVVYTIATDKVHVEVKAMLEFAEKAKIDVNALWEEVLPQWREAAGKMTASVVGSNGRGHAKRSDPQNEAGL